MTLEQLKIGKLYKIYLSDGYHTLWENPDDYKKPYNEIEVYEELISSESIILILNDPSSDKEFTGVWIKALIPKTEKIGWFYVDERDLAKFKELV